MRRYGLIWESVPGARKGSTFLQPSGTDHAEKGGTEPPTQTQLVFPHLFANRDYTLLLLIQMRLIERKFLQIIDKRKKPAEHAPRRQWLHVDIPIITEVDFSSTQLRPPRGGHDAFLCVGFLHDSRFLKM
jgi:hypothetical protein